MTDRILADAHNLKKLVREAEALADESMIAFARLKQAMLAARQNPNVNVDTGQRALMRLTQAESQAMSMSTSLLRVHDELSKVARTTLGPDEGVPTEILEADNAPADAQPLERENA
ncbi:hypothetical protein INR77_15380 [Erythrobacter sp. SCSIO 43205]|uniref:hypothetical protein n=1 Tax=Erythrobacter sp. SCSIO 43205 TaxID=2779361 RepID=UPI001CA820BF|nr:hypothetical protein [Erythrobacter sp. SCSIO 43205]UAB78106.1 hypothetical protein INR77_15380 [Erythrobacter sp. SCSIO 43205]